MQPVGAIAGILSLCTAVLAAAPACSQGQDLPTVDLGVSVTQAILNSTGAGVYSFKNIPYAEPPVGNLRFRQPRPLTTVNRTVNDGSNPRICAQAASPWFQFSIPLALQEIAAAGITPVPFAEPSPTDQSEDCLLLDVVVPKSIFDAKATKLAPVLLWIHGGGYIQGSKDESNPATLVAQSLGGGKQGIVYVAINYRLGLFGFPPRLNQPDESDIAANAGLYDQRLAMEWVAANIHLFGGDKNAVTIIGESAGGGSVVSHLTAYGGANGSLPFQRAVAQSPAIKPVQDAALLAQVYQQFLAAANVSSYAEATSLSSAQLQGVNAAIIAAGPFASTVFSPSVDGVYVPDYPGNLLAQGRVDKHVEVIVAHNLNEGLIFTDPRITNQTGFEEYLAGFMPSLPAAKVAQLAEQVYPPDFSGAQPYTMPTQRVTLAIGEGLIGCFAFGTGLAYANATRDYQFALFPGIHAQDTSYTFWNGESADGLGIPVDVATAKTMQAWFTDFAAHGAAAGSSSTATQIPLYGAGASTVNITEAGFTAVHDPAANSRCRFWLTGLTA